MGKEGIFILFGIFLLGIISAVSVTDDLHLNIQTTDSNGNIETGTFDFVFNISNANNCSASNIIYTNSTSLTTDDRGIISYYLPNVTLDYDKQYWLCYYRDGTLKDTTKLARTPYTFTAKNISASGVKNDSNLDLTNRNVTANYGLFGFLGEIGNRITSLFVQDVNASGDINASGDLYIGGNAGIGTSSPSFKLDVDGSTKTSDTYIFSDGSTQPYASTPEGNTWRIGSASYDNVNISTQDSGPNDLFFKPDGTKMYEIGFDGDKIYQSSLSTSWDLSTASYDNVNISTQDSGPSGLFFKPDGTKMYEIGDNGNKIYQSSLSTSWDLSTASYDNVNISTQDSGPSGLFFKPDGTKMYEIGLDGKIYQSSLSTPWDLSTASYDNVNISTQDALPESLFFKPDGTKMYEIGFIGDKIYQYSLSTPWDLSTASYDNVNISTQDSSPRDLFFKPDGTKLYEIGNTGNKIYQYSMGAIFDGKVGIGTSSPSATLDINGSLSKNSGSFDIEHPNPEKAEEGYRLRHYFVESNTPGDNIYRYEIETENKTAEIKLPDYFKYLNTNPQVWVSAVDVLGYGKADVDDNKINIEVSKDGTYNILVIGTRKDESAVNYFNEKGIEYKE